MAVLAPPTDLTRLSATELATRIRHREVSAQEVLEAHIEALERSDSKLNVLVHKRFEAARLPVGQRIIERARHLGAYLQATQTAEERARSQRHSIPEAVLAETAVLDFLRT